MTTDRCSLCPKEPSACALCMFPNFCYSDDSAAGTKKKVLASVAPNRPLKQLQSELNCVFQPCSPERPLDPSAAQPCSLHLQPTCSLRFVSRLPVKDNQEKQIIYPREQSVSVCSVKMPISPEENLQASVKQKKKKKGVLYWYSRLAGYIFQPSVKDCFVTRRI